MTDPGIDSVVSEKDAREAVIFASNNRRWGGCEYLWWGAALRLVSYYPVEVIVPYRLPSVFRKQAVSAGVRLKERPFTLKYRHLREIGEHWDYLWFRYRLLRNHRALKVFSLGAFYRLRFLRPLLKGSQSWVTILQSNSEWEWFDDKTVSLTSVVYQRALKNFFVSDHNRQLAERKLGIKIPRSEVLPNPLRFRAERPLPLNEECLRRWACVGRLDFNCKAQDALIVALAQDKWRQRGIQLDLYGRGDNEQLAERLIRRFNAPVRIAGYVDDVSEVWSDHGLLVLPSRIEGMPLALLEAAAHGRPAMVSALAGGASEFTVEGETGFVAPNSSPEAVDAALERAWQKRQDWQEMGANAFRKVTDICTPDGCDQLAERIKEVNRNA